MIDILILDAVPEHRETLNHLLKFADDFRVVGNAASGAEGIALAKERQPHILLVGEKLADMDGLSAVRQLQQVASQAGCILVSTRADIREQAMLAGAHDFLVLPVEMDVLFSTIRRVYQALTGVQSSDIRRESREKSEAKEDSGVKDTGTLPAVTPDLTPPVSTGSSTVRPPSPITRPDEQPAPEQKQNQQPPAPPIIQPVLPISPAQPAPGTSTPSPVPRMVEDNLSETGEVDDDEALFGGAGEEPPVDSLPDWLKADVIEEESNSRAKPALDATARFSAYYPPRVKPEQRYGLYLYAHTLNALPDIQKDVQKFAEELGGTIKSPRTAAKSAALPAGTALTVVPECDGLEFEPASLTKKWRGSWTRFEFDFVPPAQLTEDMVLVRLSIQVHGIEIAHVSCPIDISMSAGVTAQAGDLMSLPDNPLAAARLKASSANMYSKIFISYSRKDMEVVKAYRLAQLAAGHEVFMDTENIHAGENWQAALAKAIDEADIFQLFWSPHSAASANVRDEWDYCLRYKCVDNHCAGFIRPVYWQKPMPAPPQELSHLNFRFVPLNSDDEEEDA